MALGGKTCGCAPSTALIAQPLAMNKLFQTKVKVPATPIG